MGTRITDVKTALGAAENVTARTIIQGTQYRTDMALTSGGSPLDTTQWTITANCEYYTAFVTESGEGASYTLSISQLDKTPSIADKAITVGVVNAAQGKYQLLIPADLYTADIPANLEAGVPVAAICVTMRDDTVNPAAIRRFRHLLVLRRGW